MVRKAENERQRISVQTAISDVLISRGGGEGGGKRGGGGNLHMTGVGMPVVPPRRVNFGFWSHLGCSEENDIMSVGLV